MITAPVLQMRKLRPREPPGYKRLARGGSLLCLPRRVELTKQDGNEPSRDRLPAAMPGSDGRQETRRRPRRLSGPARSRNALIFSKEFNQLPVLSLGWYIRPRAAAKDNSPLLFRKIKDYGANFSLGRSKLAGEARRSPLPRSARSKSQNQPWRGRDRGLLRCPRGSF